MRRHFLQGILAVILTALAVAAGPWGPLGGSARAAGDKEYLAIRHMARGHSCETCGDACRFILTEQDLDNSGARNADPGSRHEHEHG